MLERKVYNNDDITFFFYPLIKIDTKNWVSKLCMEMEVLYRPPMMMQIGTNEYYDLLSL